MMQVLMSHKGWQKLESLLFVYELLHTEHGKVTSRMRSMMLQA